MSSDITKCNQIEDGAKCENPAIARFTWPGRDEAGICAIHAIKLEQVAAAMGLYVQMIRLTLDDYLKAEEPAQ